MATRAQGALLFRQYWNASLAIYFNNKCWYLVPSLDLCTWRLASAQLAGQIVPRCVGINGKSVDFAYESVAEERAEFIVDASKPTNINGHINKN